MVFLTSTGFTNPRVYEILIENAKKIEKACIITTAAIPLKEKNPLVIKTHDFLAGKGIETVDYIDVEFEEANKLLYYDLVFIMGGNSCHLFAQIKKSGADKILLEMLYGEHNIVGASAGAMLLSSRNKYIKYISNPLGIDEGMTNETDTRGLNITDHILYPHYDMFLEKVANLESELKDVEKRFNIEITRLKNMDFIYIDNNCKVNFVIY